MDMLAQVFNNQLAQLMWALIICLVAMQQHNKTTMEPQPPTRARPHAPRLNIPPTRRAPAPRPRPRAALAGAVSAPALPASILASTASEGHPTRRGVLRRLAPAPRPALVTLGLTPCTRGPPGQRGKRACTCPLPAGAGAPPGHLGPRESALR